MTTEEKKKVNQLADALLNDALQCETETELYHSLERMEKGMHALSDYCFVKESAQ